MDGDDRLRALLARPPRRIEPVGGLAAVSVVLVPGEVGPEVVLIRRAEHPADPWSGHIAFPGGRVEPHDEDALDAAIRETEEEIGLQLPRHAALGGLDDLAAVGGRPGLVIRPFVFHWPGRLPRVVPNREVASVHRLGLDRLLRGEGRGSMAWVHQGVPLTLPCVQFDGQRLWGLTLRMVDDLLDRIDGRGVGMERPPHGIPPAS
jgi:8-oxo-dGTP pyrophosphatase MutT (NUDIX family)